MKNLKVCDPKFLEMLLDMLIEAPENDLDPKVKDDILNFRDENHTYAEMYEFIVGISLLPIETASSFITSLCQLDEYYSKPLN